MPPAPSGCCCPTRRWTAVLSSRTMNLSFGERPVCWPVSATSAPSALSPASPRRIACAIQVRAPGGCSRPSPGGQAVPADPAGTISLSEFLHRRSPRRHLMAVVPASHPGRRSARPEDVETRKIQRYQIINRFKDFEIRLNRLYDKKRSRLAQGLGRRPSSQVKRQAACTKREASCDMSGNLCHNLYPICPAIAPCLQQEGTPAHEGAA